MSVRDALLAHYATQMRLLYNEIEQAVGSKTAEEAWRSILWKPDAFQRLLELANRQLNGTLTQPE